MTNYIDPGTSKGCAIASFQGPGLTGLAFWDQTITEAWGSVSAMSCVWEMPVIYPRAAFAYKGKPRELIARANDLIKVAAAGAGCAHSLAAQVTYKTAAAWKGQVPKPVQHARLFELLTPSEKNLLGQAYYDTARLKVGGWADLEQYIQENVRQVGLRKKPSYKARITDLLDAVCFGLVEEGRMK